MNHTLRKMSVLTRKALLMIEAERARQDSKWGVQRHNAATWYLIMGEEFGEVGQAMQRELGWGKETDKSNEIEELTHLAAVAVARIEQLLEEK